MHYLCVIDSTKVLPIYSNACDDSTLADLARLLEKYLHKSKLFWKSGFAPVLFYDSSLLE